MKKLSTHDLVSIPLFSALIAVCSMITIPFVIPFTLQTFAVFTAIFFLGTFKGFLSVLLYLMLGLIGLPVFAGFKSGITVLFQATGGYLLGFLLTAICTGLLIKYFHKISLSRVLTSLIGLVICYICGTIWFVTVYSINNTPIGLLSILNLCVFPFIIPDILKILLADLIYRKLYTKVKKYIK